MTTHDGLDLPLWSLLPFAALILAIAMLPLLAPAFWARNANKAAVSLLLATPVGVGLVLSAGAAGGVELGRALADYCSFIVLLGSLFVVTGGIRVRGSHAGTTAGNVGLLAAGVVLANVVGTTGASMALIRPLLASTVNRTTRAHIVMFFIFTVSNTGGMLTPLGDPPLFLGFLKGVPFEWTLGLWRPWLLVNGTLLLVFAGVDRAVLRRERTRRENPAVVDGAYGREPGGARLRIDGWPNLLFLAAIVLVILSSGAGWGVSAPWPFGLRESLMVALAFAAYLSTPRRIRVANGFNLHPLVEVGVLFLGIFVTMIAPLQILNARGEALGIAEPWQYFWCTGAVSSVLDNAPTYLTFAAKAAGQLGISLGSTDYLAEMLRSGPAADRLLTAVACGAVMMGALTYIGNGPNFMVKAIAEEHGVKMPTFIGYLRYSALVLLPIFLVVSLVFF